MPDEQPQRDSRKKLHQLCSLCGIKIKRVTKATQRSDPFLNKAIPLAAVVRLHEEHNHGLDCADGLRLLRSTPDTRAAFFDNVKSRMTPAGALSLHRENLGAQEDGGSLLANGARNPSPNTVYHWFRIWKRANYGEDLVDPLSKLAEKAPSHLQNGCDVRIAKSEDGSCWAVLVVMAIMKGTQALDTTREIVFLDSTASCDESQTTATIALAATQAGAVPLAVLLHNSQSTDSYKAAFGLLKESYPVCFGGAHAPQVFTTDNSAAEKAALRATWPQSIQLLCHFHVAQAEWCWLHASHNNISRHERQELMTAFQKDAAELLKQIQEEQWRQYSLAVGNPYYLTALQKVLGEMKKIQREPQVIASYLAMKAACTSARRRGRTIKVHPTSIARRCPGVNRGSGRVPAGRPAKSMKTKRPHALHLSIKDGVPQAKAHEAGH